MNEILQGDALELAKTLPDNSIHCIVTSPPYWGLRDYGTATWQGGSAECDHVERSARGDKGRCSDDSRSGNINPSPVDTPIQYRHTCPKCGAIRIDDQIGLEPTPEEYIEKMVTLFRELRRALHPSGTLWLNMGDSYAGNNSSNGEGETRNLKTEKFHGGRAHLEQRRTVGQSSLPQKNLIGIPWRLALALQADGWVLRSDIIWAKPNPMPESVTDRPTKAHEYIFLLTKSARYFYDAEAVREAITSEHSLKRWQPGQGLAQFGLKEHNRADRGRKAEWNCSNGRNKRTVWQVATQPYPESHFATFPPKLIEPMILAGTSAKGVCPAKVTKLKLRDDLTPERRKEVMAYLKRKKLI